MVCDHSPRVRHLGMWSQVGLRKHHYEQSYWRWWNSNWAISNPKRYAVQMMHSTCQQIWKTQQWPQAWKRWVFIPIPKKVNAKECSNYCTIALISHTSKVILNILQVRLQNMWTKNFQMLKLDLEKAEEPEIKLPTSIGSQKKQGDFRKISTYASLTMLKPLTVWLTNKLWQTLRVGNTRSPYLPS